MGRGGRGGAWREGRGGMGEGWVRGRRWDGRRGSYAAHLQSTRRRCRRGWTPKRGAPWVERGWTPLPFQCFAPADSTREISTVPLYASHPRQKFEFRGVLPSLTKTRRAGATGGAACGASGGAVNAWGQLWLRSRSWAMASNSSEETNSSDRVVSIQNGSSHSRQVTAVRSHTQHIGRRFTSE